MKIVDTLADSAKTAKRTHRTYTVEFKAQVVRECDQPGASVARVAMGHGINANLVHRWRRELEYRLVGPVQSAFVPVTLDSGPGLPPVAAASADIRVQVHKGACKVVIHWPTQSAQACAAWLSDWLK
ncbi:MAG: transposase [Pseudomonadota bacterium]